MITDRGVEGALLRYRTMAYIVGTGLLILVVVGIPLQYGAGVDGVVKVIGPIHGFAYLVYLFFALDLWRRERWSLTRIVAMVAAGFVPGLAFYVERQMTRRFTNETVPPSTPSAHSTAAGGTATPPTS
jgi:integral membrane protein